MLKALAMPLRGIPLSDPVVPIGLRTWCSAGRLRRFNGGGRSSNSVQKAHGRSELLVGRSTYNRGILCSEFRPGGLDYELLWVLG